MKTIFEETYKSERTRFIEEQQKRHQPLLPTTAIQEITCSHQPIFTQTEIRTGSATTASNLLQHTQHQGMTPPPRSLAQTPTQQSTFYKLCVYCHCYLFSYLLEFGYFLMFVVIDDFIKMNWIYSNSIYCNYMVFIVIVFVCEIFIFIGLD